VLYASCMARRLFRATRQLVAYAIGDRSQATRQRLWAAIPQAQHAAPASRALRQEELGISESDMMRESCLRLFPHDHNKSVALSCD
jgi:hypothetical protein